MSTDTRIEVSKKQPPTEKQPLITPTVITPVSMTSVSATRAKGSEMSPFWSANSKVVNAALLAQLAVAFPALNHYGKQIEETNFGLFQTLNLTEFWDGVTSLLKWARDINAAKGAKETVKEVIPFASLNSTKNFLKTAKPAGAMAALTGSFLKNFINNDDTPTVPPSTAPATTTAVTTSTTMSTSSSTTSSPTPPANTCGLNSITFPACNPIFFIATLSIVTGLSVIDIAESAAKCYQGKNDPATGKAYTGLKCLYLAMENVFTMGGSTVGSVSLAQAQGLIETKMPTGLGLDIAGGAFGVALALKIGRYIYETCNAPASTNGTNASINNDAADVSQTV